MKRTRRGTGILVGLLLVAACGTEPPAPPAAPREARARLNTRNESHLDKDMTTSYGHAIAISGGHGAVSTPTPEGGVYFYDGRTSVVGTSVGAGGVNQEEFGWDVDIDGTSVIVGWPLNLYFTTVGGAARVFVKSTIDYNWPAQDSLRASDAQDGDELGRAVAIHGDSALAGAPGAASGTGAAYVFTRTDPVWTEQGKLVASDGVAGDAFGAAVGLEADTAVVAAPNHGNGAVYVFTRSGTTWSEQQRLAGSSASGFGSSLAISGNTLLVGQPALDDAAAAAGGVHVYRFNGSWQLDTTLTASDAEAGVGFGYDVDLDGTTAVVGMNTTGIGRAYLFSDDGAGFVEQEIVAASDGSAGDGYGRAVAVSQDELRVGAPGFGTTGTVYAYRIAGSNGAACSDRMDCASDRCVDGVCCDVACDQPCQACSVAAGAAADGVCGPVADGASCDDQNACTQVDSCVAGECVGGSPVVCEVTNECIEQATCDEKTGSCVDVPFRNGSECGANSHGVCFDGACDPRDDSGGDGGCACRSGAAGASGWGGYLAWALLVALGGGRVARRRARRRR